MTAWEYCCVGYSPATGVKFQHYGEDKMSRDGLADLGQEIAALGRQGWELVSVVREGALVEWYFKRPPQR